MLNNIMELIKKSKQVTNYKQDTNLLNCGEMKKIGKASLDAHHC